MARNMALRVRSRVVLEPVITLLKVRVRAE